MTPIAMNPIAMTPIALTWPAAAAPISRRLRATPIRSKFRLASRRGQTCDLASALAGTANGSLSTINSGVSPS